MIIGDDDLRIMEQKRSEQRYQFIKVLLWIGTVALPLLGWVDFQNNFMVSAFGKFAIASICPVMLYVGRQNKYRYKITIIIAFSFFFMTLFSSLSKAHSIYGIIWIPLMPLMYIYTAGAKFGTIQIAIYFLAMISSIVMNYELSFGVEPEVYYQIFFAYLLAAVLAYIYEKNQQSHHLRMQEQIDTDFLTGIMNRRCMVKRLELDINQHKTNKNPFCVMLIDLDNFKQINDLLGHDAGDDILIEFADFVKTHLRQADYFARWGGEEFIIMLPSTSLESARLLAERLRIQLTDEAFSHNVNLTVSIGVTEFKSDDTFGKLIQRADRLQYRAKETKNCVVAERELIVV